MAIIVCPECGKEISDENNFCVHCGYPIKPAVDANNIINPKDESNVFAKKNLKKWIILIAAVVAVVIVAVVVIIAIKGNSLNSSEQYVYSVVSKYKNYLKDPDSLQLRGDILYVVDSEHDTYVIFGASGNNSYGARVSSMPVFVNKSYIGNYGDDPDDLDDVKDKLKLAKANLIVAYWNLVGQEMEGDEYPEVELISGKKIASKLHCDWTK